MLPATLQASGERNPLDSTMGSMLIGTVVSAVLYGVSIVQTLYYYSRYPGDTRIYKILVAVIMFLDTIHLIMIMHTIYHYLITTYYDADALTVMTWSVLAESIPTGVTGSLVQCFYAYRLWNLSGHNIILTGSILVLVLATSGCGTAWVILSLMRNTYTELLQISGLTMSINALSAAVDIIIAASLCIMLQQSRTGFKRSDSTINKLIIFIVNTGLLTSLCAIGALVSLIVSPNTLIYASWYFCIGRLYSNSFLASLNARRILRGQICNTDVVDISSDDIISMPQFASTPTGTTGAGVRSRPARGDAKNIAIRIDTTMTLDQHMDDEDKTSTAPDSDIMKSSASSIGKN